jgi:hypothetical protein
MQQLSYALGNVPLDNKELGAMEVLTREEA